MNVTSATDTASTPSASTGSATSASNQVVDQNTFLKLLIAQMKNQDPSSPMDTSQMMTQFSQMSQAAQAVPTHSTLDALLSSSALSQADGLIGRTANLGSDAGKPVSGKITAVSINKDGAIANLDN